MGLHKVSDAGLKQSGYKVAKYGKCGYCNMTIIGGFSIDVSKARRSYNRAKKSHERHGK